MKIFNTNTVLAAGAMMLFSCQKIEESVTTIVTDTKEQVQQKAMETVHQTITEQVSRVVKAEDVAFDSVFIGSNDLQLSPITGKKIVTPSGSPYYVFKYKTPEKELLLQSLTEQPTTDESRSSKEYKKVDGASIIEKIAFVEKFIPGELVNVSFLNELRTDKTIEYYKISRFPNSSTVIYHPKDQTVWHFVEVLK